ncbi:hypothetical protein TBR22_A18090 [Luteitalea sp. TBR-22]|uniref:DUF2721 domain-containing protein n=1 Tax=Luteitalea sp. TBR-22 TaxID=2802971 RepID=UPI001AF5E7BB|nr:DUF2721 domain-containing protein [Luteitalea sp. TBR-22]BCS32595.1 hypothetical protein TBR22_A18090 [Luteitalea sp. TBR-22]
MEPQLSVLAAIVAPAVLTNASSVLTLGMGNRLVRVVDRTRVVLADLADPRASDTQREALRDQLQDLKRRTRLLLAAQRCFFVALGSFAAVALLCVVAAATSASAGPVTAWATRLALAAGAAGVVGLACGCGAMLIETQVALRNLSREVAMFEAEA